MTRLLGKTLKYLYSGEALEDLLNNRMFQDIATWAGYCYLFYYFTK